MGIIHQTFGEIGSTMIELQFLPISCALAHRCLLAKLGRSTRDTKEGYKTKTGSTSSVTLALPLG